jgi:hypothetical protein
VRPPTGFREGMRAAIWQNANIRVTTSAGKVKLYMKFRVMLDGRMERQHATRLRHSNVFTFLFVGETHQVVYDTPAHGGKRV